jgi:sporulation-control protein spo0M
MPAQIALQLDKPAYRPGDIVRGTLHLTARTDLRPRGVVVHAFGEEVTMLGLNTLMTQRSHPFDLSFNLWSPTAHKDRLPTGEYDFPFEFTLPAALPPTFNGEFTRIVYVIEGKVDLPLHTDIRHEVALHILPAPLAEADKPLRATARSPHGVTLELALNASGYYPGDHVQGTLQVTSVESITLTAATVEIVSRERGEAREFTDHFDKVRVRAEIDPAHLIGGQPFPIDLPIPADADPSFVGQHSAKSRLVRARIDYANAPALIVEAPIVLGAK